MFDLDKGMTKEQINKFAKGLDANGDMKIDYEEYVKWASGK